MRLRIDKVLLHLPLYLNRFLKRSGGDAMVTIEFRFSDRYF